jgi:SMC interacting uncharacterized protein involved in chromosome segregation
MKPEDVMKALEWYALVSVKIGSATVPCDELNGILALLRENDALIEALAKNNADLEDELAETHDLCEEKDGEIERLQGALKAEERHNELTMETAQKALAEKDAEIERLKELATTKEVEKELVRSSTKVDTLRKMQERLKGAFNFGHTILEKSICDIIDQIAKEMLEANE